VPTSDPNTVALFQNPRVMRVNQASTNNREVFREHNLVLWTAQATDGPEHYIAAFNLGVEPLQVALDSQNVGLPAHLTGLITDLWTGDPVETRPVTVQSNEARGVAPGSTAIYLTIPPHGARLLSYQPTK